jgi:predicted metallo-beta-lactamase superfamily hydrolase
MLVGYLVLFGLPLLYVLGWRLRERNLEKDIELLKTLSEEKQD